MQKHTNNDPDEQGLTTYAMIPTWVIRSGGKLSGNAVRLYAVIMTYADNVTKVAFPSRETLAGDMGVSINTVKRAIKELEEADAVRVKRERNKRNGNFFANEYWLAYDEPWATSEPWAVKDKSPRATDGPPPRATDEPPPRATDGPITKPNLTKPTELTNPLGKVPLRSVDKLFSEEEFNEELLHASRQPDDEKKAVPPPPDATELLDQLWPERRGKKAS